MSGPGTEVVIGTYYGETRTRQTTGPAGLGTVGPSSRGPAFVPIGISDIGQYVNSFGNISAANFATLAVSAWLDHSAGCTFIRLLGIGDGRKRLETALIDSTGENLPAGAVKNSGFIVGSRLTGSNGYLGSNPFAVDGGLPGRVYFLGTFMSNSAGSTYLSDAGIQTDGTNLKASATTAGLSTNIVITSKYAGVTYNGRTFQLQVDPSAARGAGILECTFSGTPEAIKLTVQLNSDAPALGTSAEIVDIINLGYSSTIATPVVTDPSNLRSLVSATGGDSVLLADTDDQTITFGDGTNGFSVPILRGVLFAASGVLPALSGNYTGNASSASMAIDGVPGSGATVGSFAPGQDGGSTIGSVNLSSGQESFKLLLNGHQNDDHPSEIVASFNPVAIAGSGEVEEIIGNPLYIGEVLNTDPTKIRETGHYLYTHYEIPQALAQASGTGSIASGTEKETATGNWLYDIAFLVTASLPRNVSDSAGSLGIPNFENFSDRYQAAKSPTVFSQYIQNKQHDLFRFHALDDGEFGNDQVKISITNLQPPEEVGSYGSFDITVRSWDNLDEAFTGLSGSTEQFLGCNLNPESDSYIAKMIGDQHYYYNFDAKRFDGQRFVLDGQHANNSALVRVEVVDSVENQTLPTEVLPAGFHGFGHLITSGSSIMSNPEHPLNDIFPSSGDNPTAISGSVISSLTNWAHKIVEPPITYRISLGDDDYPLSSTPSERSLGNFCWGVQTTKIPTIKQPNLDNNQNQSIKSYTTYFPSFSTIRQNAYVSDNVGVADSNGTIYDVDRFNNNKFSLENILVHVDSSGAVRSDEWAYARYSRNRKKIPLIDSTLIEITDPTRVRFLNFNKDVTPSKINTIVDFLKFTFIMQGGFDGFNIFSREKAAFSNLAAYFEMLDPAQGTTEGQVVSAYLKALQMLEDKSEVEIKLLALPGIRIEAITNKAIGLAEDRFDTFYVMDIEEISTNGNVVTSSTDVPSTALTAENFKSRAMDSTFTAVYFPDIQMADPASAIGTLVYAPPSISVIRVFGRLDGESNINAPAGFSRGLIAAYDEDTALAIQTKIPMGDVDQATKISTLYSASINPIIDSESGLCLFGQRTLMSSAETMLQRISVRRMIIDIRRYVKTVARAVLFDQNRDDVLQNFREGIEPILSMMKDRGGISRYKVVVDETTTSQADIENNIVRGKVFLQPNKSDEIIQVDFTT